VSQTKASTVVNGSAIDGSLWLSTGTDQLAASAVLGRELAVLLRLFAVLPLRPEGRIEASNQVVGSGGEISSVGSFDFDDEEGVKDARDLLSCGFILKMENGLRNTKQLGRQGSQKPRAALSSHFKLGERAARDQLVFRDLTSSKERA
jgi:hypothetical protein